MGVRDAIGDVKDELISMQSFLVDADKKGTINEGEKTWVANVRDLANEVEDVIDQFMYHIISQQTGGRSAREMVLINNYIEGTSSKDNHKWIVRRSESSLFLKENELVGIENKRQLIMGWFMDGEPHQTVISIVGMGGSGKTTLVANTYNNDDEASKSSRLEFHELQIISKNTGELFREEMYLLVLDDIWDTNVLDEIKVLLQDSCLGSRIILTTRKEDVACYHLGGKHHIHHIQLLQKEEAWELFCKKAFSSSPNGSCPWEFKSFAQTLVGKCEGLPLAITASGSLMYSKNLSQWNKIYSNLNWSLSKNPKLEAVNKILLLSFNDLPYHLKHCFLYCSLFPEDHGI
ncbi:disease resistance protein RPM1-like [Quercus lobata]|uniref:disease resistance protein RPM1-like n=1 Tax=Quercus lobata TaxID=97700 RepID=UPI0012474C65|nr:disease resistance protein RPM1-like [Quercus lobata]